LTRLRVCARHGQMCNLRKYPHTDPAHYVYRAGIADQRPHAASMAHEVVVVVAAAAVLEVFPPRSARAVGSNFAWGMDSEVADSRRPCLPMDSARETPTA